MSRRRQRRPRPLTTSIADRVGNLPLNTQRPRRPMATCRPPEVHITCSRPTLPRLVAELEYVAMQRDINAELLPGSPATIALSRGGNLVALLVVPSEAQARSLLGLPTEQRDRHADALWELDRHDRVEQDECYAN